MAGLGLLIHSIAGMIKDSRKEKEAPRPAIEYASYTETITGQINNHSYVDLGLPSGLKWATCNVGASSPVETGCYYFWGEVQPRQENIDYSKFVLVTGNAPSFKTCLTKYNIHKQYGTIDGLIQLESDDDAARMNWGETWRTPSKKDFEELINYCRWERAKFGDIKGTKVTGPNGNAIFFPYIKWHMYSFEADLYYWSSSLYTDDSFYAWRLSSSYKPVIQHSHRNGYFAIRAVSQ